MMNLKTDLSKFNNSWYKPGSTLKRAAWYIVHGVFFMSSFPISSVKVTMLRLFGARVGNGVVIKPHVRIKYPWRLIIGNHVWIGEDCWIDNLAQVTIGNSVCLSQGSFLLCGNHDFSKSTFDLMIGEIVLEDGVWIGAKSTVCPGVVCSSHAVLAVGSVATKNLEPYSIYQGNPAVKIKERILSA
jgi:putative colanic acid biosynthesis acetyltransferase WcaF